MNSVSCVFAVVVGFQMVSCFSYLCIQVFTMFVGSS